MMGLSELQRRVHVSKDKRNDFGGYNYRTAEGILAAIKAELPEGATIVVSDTLQEVAGQIFVTAKATIRFDDGSDACAEGHAMHPLTKKGMDPSQITGSASSYARKYALAGLVALDDGSVDPDAAKEPYQEEPTPPAFDPAAARDRIKAKLEKAQTLDDLGDAWKSEQPAIMDVRKASEPMFNELNKAKEDRKATLGAQLTNQGAG